MSSIFKLYSHEDCDFYYDGELEGHIIGNNDRAFRFEVERKGTYRALFVNSRNKTPLRMDLIIESDEELNIDINFKESDANIIESGTEVVSHKTVLIPDEKQEFNDAVTVKSSDCDNNDLYEITRRKAVEEAEAARIKEEQVRIDLVKTEKKQHIESRNTISKSEIFSQDIYFSNGLARVKKNGMSGFIDREYKLAIPFIYDEVDNFIDGLARVRKKGKYGFINTKGVEIIPCIYDKFCTQINDWIKARRRGKWGVVAATGKEIIPCLYNYVNEFHEGFAAVKKNDKWGFINPAGQMVIAPSYDEVYYFIESRAVVRQDKKYFVIDKYGNKL